MRKCRWSSTRHDAVVLTGEFWGFVSVLTATSNVVLCVCPPAPVQFLQSFFPKCQAFHVIVFALLSFSYDSSSSSQYFLHAGSFNPRWCFKAGEGDEQRSPPIRRESRVEEAGTYVTDDESIGQSVSLSHPKPGRLQVTAKGRPRCPSDRWHLFILCGERRQWRSQRKSACRLSTVA